MTATTIHAAGVVAVAGVFGAMVFFAFVYAPLVFIKLGTETGGRFIREVSPVYYMAMGTTSIAAAMLLALAGAARGPESWRPCLGVRWTSGLTIDAGGGYPYIVGTNWRV